MIHLFVVAGMSERHERYVDSLMRKKVASESGHLLIVPAGTPVPGYSDAYRDRILSECAKWVSTKALDDAFSVSLLYAPTNDGSEEKLLSDFFPFALSHRFVPLKDVHSKNDIQREVNIWVKSVVPICAALRSRTRIMHEHLSRRIRKSPLMLPAKNFKSKDLLEVLKFFQLESVMCEPLESHIREKEKALNAKIKSVRLPEEKEDAYVNDDGLAFRSPRYDNFHAMANGAGHPPVCYLRARARLGGSFNPRFHYDCVSARGGLKNLYPSCHGDFENKNKEYVNIAPSDFVRS